MSVQPQFLGMREAHDDHRDVVTEGPYRSWRDCDACLAIVAWDEVTRMLEDLTPGGSEFYRDPTRCVALVRDRIARLTERSKELTVAKQRMDQLEAQLRNCRQGKTNVKRQRDAAYRGGPRG